MEATKPLYFLLFLLQCHVQVLKSYSIPCAFNSMCLCWIQDDSESNQMDISCLGVPFSRFPDVSVSNVAQLDIVSSGMQVLENDALVSFSGIETLGLMSNRLSSIGEKSLVVVASSLRSLDFSYNSLEAVPFEALRRLKKLIWLNMHSNHLTSLDGDWGHVAKTLTNGFFGENCIVEIPRVMSQFENLVLLNMDGNDIQDIPETSLPSNIRTISFNKNLLKYFPMSIGNLPFINAIYLRGNFIKNLTLPIFKNPFIELIDVSENIIESIVLLNTNNQNNNNNNNNNDTLIIQYVGVLNLSRNKVRVLSAGVFQYLKPRRIHLSSNGIRIIEDGAFHGLENTLEYLSLEHNDLIILPSAISTMNKINFIYFGKNNINNITNNAFDSFGNNLRALSLTTNNLNKIPVLLLSNCKNIIHLNLGYNKIAEINTSDFKYMKNIEILLLRNNMLTKLKANTFKELEHLRELSMSFNHFIDIDDNAFSGIDNTLEVLEMSFSFTNDYYPKIAFSKLKKLLWLVIDNNNFHNIDYDIFYNLYNLRYINIESNRLQILPSKLFHYNIHRELRDIKFGYNFIQEIPVDIFFNLNELRSIDLTGNRILKIDKLTIYNCTKLVTISMAYNQISFIEKYAFYGLTSLRFLHIEFNALTVLDFDAIVDTGGMEFSLNASYNSISVIKYQYKLFNLTSLDLAYNNISQLENNIFYGMPNLRNLNLRGNFITALHSGTFALAHLEMLNLCENRLETLRKQAFYGTPMLQILDLSGNLLSQLANEQFRNMINLRIINLSKNRIRTLSRDIFEGSRVESLDLSDNIISIIPSMSFIEIGYTLRDLDIANNIVEHIDSTTFPTSQLTYLNLANNKLTILPDNSFVSLTKLLSLNLSNNNFQSNSKELFHYLPELRQLFMENCGFKKVPIIPVSNINILDLSFNPIEDSSNIEVLRYLKVLRLVNNSLAVVPDVRLDLLRELHLSGNPIEEINKESFFGFPRLQKLVLRKLIRIKYVSKNCLKILRYLKDISIQSWPQADGFDLKSILIGLPLSNVEIEVTEPVLKNQIHNAFTRRLRELTITGQELEAINLDAFKTFEGSSELILRIKDTHVRNFQPDLFFHLAKSITQLTLDLRNNNIKEFSPSAIYGNLSWEIVGTNFVSGGLQVSGNPLECDCEIAWLSLWLRRWLRESRQIHTASQSDARQLRNMAGRAVCRETTPSHSSNWVLLTLGTPYTACQASALSSGHHVKSAKYLTFIIIIIMRFIIDWTNHSCKYYSVFL